MANLVLASDDSWCSLIDWWILQINARAAVFTDHPAPRTAWLRSIVTGPNINGSALFAHLLKQKWIHAGLLVMADRCFKV